MNKHLTPENLAVVREKGRHEIYFEPGGLRVTASDLLDEIERLRAVLRELVALKDMKDRRGKIKEYERRQPIAWQVARETLP